MKLRPTFEVFTLFPELIQGVLSHGLLGKACQRENINIFCTNYRQFADNSRGTVDDTPYGGGPGMVMRVEPVVAALEHVQAERGPMHRILLTPSAPRFNQQMAERLARLPRIGLLCGRYEGIDDRVREGFVDECISIGDFILNGGEIAALAVIEAVARLCEGVLGNPQSIRKESFVQNHGGAWLEAPQYTRPEQFRGQEVPAVLLSGDHQAIATWRAKQSWLRTWNLRPDLRLQGKSLAIPPMYVLLFDLRKQSDLQKLVSCFSQTRIISLESFEPEQIIRKIRKIHRQPIHPVFVNYGVNEQDLIEDSSEIPFISHPQQLFDFLTLDGKKEFSEPLLLIPEQISHIPQNWKKWLKAIFVPAPISPIDLQFKLAKRSPISESLQPQVLADPFIGLIASALIQLQNAEVLPIFSHF